MEDWRGLRGHANIEDMVKNGSSCGEPHRYQSWRNLIRDEHKV